MRSDRAVGDKLEKGAPALLVFFSGGLFLTFSVLSSLDDELVPTAGNMRSGQNGDQRR